MIKQLFATILLLAALALPTLAQSTTPTRVQTQRMLLLLWSDPVNGTNAINDISGLSTDGKAAITSSAPSFLTTYTGAIANYNAAIVPPGYSDPASGMIAVRDAAVTNTFTTIHSQVGSSDDAIISAYVTQEQNNGDVHAAPSSDIVAVRKLLQQGGGWLDSVEGIDVSSLGGVEAINIDGAPGQSPACQVSATANIENDGGNVWSTISTTVPAGTTNLSTAVDGTVLLRTSASSLYIMNAAHTFDKLSGGGLEISGSAIGGIYTVGTDNRLYALNLHTNVWSFVGGAGYPFTTNVKHVAAGGPDYSVWAAGGTFGNQIVGYIPSVGWVTVGDVPSPPVSMTTYAWEAQYGLWTVYMIGANGQFYAGYYQVVNGVVYTGIQVNPNGFSGFTGTPKDIHFNGGDRSFTLRTTTGIFRTLSGGSVFSAVSGQTGNVLSSDSVSGLYLINSAGNLVRYFANNVVSSFFIGRGDQYVSSVDLNVINNLPLGFNFASPESSSVYSVCKGITYKILDWLSQVRTEAAYSRGRPTNAGIAQVGDGNFKSCYYPAVAYCSNGVPDWNVPYIWTQNDPNWPGCSSVTPTVLNAADGIAYCFSLNGNHQPWHCGPGVAFATYRDGDPGPSNSCKSNP